MTEKEKRHILKRLRRTIEEAVIVLRSLEIQFKPKKVHSSKSKTKRKN